MTRPSSIVAFERLFLLSTLLGLVNTVLLVPHMNLEGSGLSHGAVVATAWIGGLIGAAIMLALWYFAARRGAVVAKWLLVALGAYTLFSLVYGAAQGSLIGGALGASVIAAAVLQLASVAMLFRADASLWFAAAPEEPLA